MLARHAAEQHMPCAPEERASLLQKHRLERLQMQKRLVLESGKKRPAGSSAVGVDTSSTRKSSTELVLFRANQAFAAYRVTYRLRHHVAHPFGDSRRSSVTIMFIRFRSCSLHHLHTVPPCFL